MKAPDALSQLESPLADMAAYVGLGVDRAHEMNDELQEAFQPLQPWAKSLADRPTPDDWPVHD